MASIEKRIRNGKTRYYVRFRTPEGQQRRAKGAQCDPADATERGRLPHPGDARAG